MVWYLINQGAAETCQVFRRTWSRAGGHRDCKECRSVGGLRGRMSEIGRQVNGLFESLLSQAMDGGR